MSHTYHVSHVANIYSVYAVQPEKDPAHSMVLIRLIENGNAMETRSCHFKNFTASKHLNLRNYDTQ